MESACRTGRLVGGLAEEGGELPTASLVVASGAEAGELARGLDERVVGVECALAAAVAAVLEHVLEHRTRDDVPHALLPVGAAGRGEQRGAGEEEQRESLLHGYRLTRCGRRCGTSASWARLL
jgi:hypothetical protein